MSALTDGRIAEIEQRLAAVTPGVWMRCTAPSEGSSETHAEYMANSLCGIDPNLHVVIAPSTDDEYAYFTTAVTGDGPTSAANAELIAHAPADLAELLAEVKRLRGAR